MPGEEMAVAVHVGIQRGRRRPVPIKMMVEIQLAERDAADEEQHDQQIAKKFIVRDHLEEQREHRQQNERECAQRDVR